MKKIVVGLGIGILIFVGFTRFLGGTRLINRYIFNDKDAPTIVSSDFFYIYPIGSSSEEVLDKINCYDNVDEYCNLKIVSTFDSTRQGMTSIEVQAKDSAGNTTIETFKVFFTEENDNNHLSRPEVTITVQNYGEMTLVLYPNIAPITVNNFIFYILNNSYTGSSFHRVIEGFMIQGGKVEETICPIYGEFSNNGFDNPLLHTRGVLAMARTMQSMNSQTSQFFIMHEDYPYLDGDYTTFGKLTSGYNVLDAIAEIDTDMNDAPLQQVVITEITVDLDGYELSEVDCYE